MFKLTAPETRAVFALAPGTFARISPELLLVQNKRRITTVRFLLTSMAARCTLLGSNSAMAGSSSNLSIEPNGSVTFLVSGGADQIILPAGSIHINNWYTLRIDEFDGSPTNTTIYLNGVAANTTQQTQAAPLIINFIGLGPTTGAASWVTSATTYFEYIKIEYDNAVVADISFAGIPTSNPAVSGSRTVLFSDPNNVIWHSKSSANLTCPAVDLSSPTWELELEFRPSKTNMSQERFNPC